MFRKVLPVAGLYNSHVSCHIGDWCFVNRCSDDLRVSKRTDFEFELKDPGSSREQASQQNKTNFPDRS